MQVGVYEQQQRDRARALKAKFYGSQRPTVRQTTVSLPPEERPEWKRTSCWFNEHVIAFRRYAAFEEKVRTFGLSQTIILDMAGEVVSKRSLRDICEEVLLRYPSVSLADVRGVRRTREVVAARHACIKAVYDERTDISSPIIGKYFLRDHTVVLYAAGRLTHRKSQANEERNRNRISLQART